MVEGLDALGELFVQPGEEKARGEYLLSSFSP